MIKTVLVGHGYWGPNLLRVINNSRFGKVVAVLDIDKKQKKNIDKKIKFFSDKYLLLKEVNF